jgi:hypothetical protein
LIKAPGLSKKSMGWHGVGCFVERELMYWMFGGYLAAFIGALATHAALTIGSHPKPMAGLAAYFVLLPIMIGALGGEAMIAISDEHKARVRRAIDSRRLSRRYVFWCGFFGGLAVIGFLWAGRTIYSSVVGRILIGKADDHILWIALTAIFALALGPIGPAVWVINKASKRLDPE